ncbi:hypothetical protein BGZ94_005289 [Podila epigama]|nr:hypothetical protein BGZ94_005289 [Podila epigama]
MMITAKIERNTSSPGHSREKPLLRISTENRGRIPIQGLKGVLRIGIAKDGEDGIDASMDCGGTILTSSTTTLVRGKQEVKKTAPVLYVTGKSSAPSELLTLPPETKWEHVLELELAGFDDWHIELVAEFMNVGSARPLTRKLDCCVYLLDQCTIHWLREQSRTPNELACFQANMRTANVRQVLHVPATEGISTGSGFSLTPTADELIIHGRVENITDDGTGATIAVWCEYSSAIDNMEDFVPTEQLLQVVASRVTEELAVLDEMLAETK